MPLVSENAKNSKAMGQGKRLVMGVGTTTAQTGNFYSIEVKMGTATVGSSGIVDSFGTTLYSEDETIEPSETPFLGHFTTVHFKSLTKVFLQQ